MSELAEKLIAENIKTKNPTLDLGNCGLDGTEDELYKPLRDATHLETLILANRWNWLFTGNEWISDKSNNQGNPNTFSMLPKYLPHNIFILKFAGENDWCIQNINSLGQLKYLQDLDLSYNQIQNIDVLQKLKNLEYLDLDHNNIESISSLINLTNLKKLFLSENNIETCLGLEDLQKLTKLHLDYNKVINIEALRNLTQLKELLLTDNKIQDVVHLKNLTSLEILYLTSNPINDIKVLAKLSRLKQLTLDTNYLSHSPPIWYIYLKNKEGKMGDYTHLSELPQVEKIWQVMQNGEEENINLAQQLAMGQGWTEEEFEMYQKLLYC